ncbi:MAG: hypothetical protein AAF405_09275 [Pseudomonadota bacterium]
MCHAANSGDIYAYEYVGFDLLEGAGLTYLEVMNISLDVMSEQDIAEELCVTGAWVEPAQVIASHPDGLPANEFVPGFTVYIQDGAGDTYLCNASGDGSIWAFAPLGEPLNVEYVG